MGKIKNHYDVNNVKGIYINTFNTLGKAINNVFSEYENYYIYFNEKDITNNDLIIDFFDKNKILKLKIHVSSFSILYLDRNLNDYISLLNDLKHKIKTYD